MLFCARITWYRNQIFAISRFLPYHKGAGRCGYAGGVRYSKYSPPKPGRRRVRFGAYRAVHGFDTAKRDCQIDAGSFLP